MQILDPAGESLRLAEHYRRLTDDELIEIVRHSKELTETAQQALALEVSSRKLTVPANEPPVVMRPAPSLKAFDDPDPQTEDDPYAEDRKLFEIRKVWSEADARRLERVLDIAGIPFFMGREKATSVEEVTSNFAEGVPVSIMRIGWPWAYDAIYRNYFPKDEVPEPSYEDAGDVAIHCPRCGSTDVVFEKLVDEPEASAPKYQWTCDNCGYEWKDEGVETQQ